MHLLMKSIPVLLGILLFSLNCTAAGGGKLSREANELYMAKSRQAKSDIDSSAAAREMDAFYMTKITDDVFARIKGKSFKKDCTLPRKDLRYLHVLHKDINGKVILELTCRNPQCSNRGKVVTEVESGTPTADNKS